MVEQVERPAWWDIPARIVERLRWEWVNRDQIRRAGLEAHKRLGPR